MVINYPSSIDCPLEVFIPLVAVQLELQGFHVVYCTMYIDIALSYNMKQEYRHKHKTHISFISELPLLLDCA